MLVCADSDNAAVAGLFCYLPLVIPYLGGWQDSHHWIVLIAVWIIMLAH